MASTAPSGFTLRVPDSYDGIKLEAYQRGVWAQEIGLNAGPGHSTDARRRSQPQVEAREMFEQMFPEPTSTAPGGRGWARDHIIELQHDLTGERGRSPFDYRWQDSALNSREGSQSWALQKDNPFLEPAGGVSRAGTSTRFYNTSGYRTGVRWGGNALLVYGIYQTGDHVVGAIQADINDGTGGRQTARAVATEAGGWTGAAYGAKAGAAAGLWCGEAAPICSPVFALILGTVGYRAGSGAVEEAIDVVPTEQETNSFFNGLERGVYDAYGFGSFYR